jgi:hypothetical protein
MQERKVATVSKQKPLTAEIAEKPRGGYEEVTAEIPES